MDGITNADSINAPEKKKILIIEDDFYIRDLYEKQAVSMGYDVISAADGLEGLDRIIHHKPDLVILDIMLPKIDGLTILKKTRENPECSSTPFIIITNMDNSQKEKEIRELGVVDYYVKVMVTPDSIIQRANAYFSNGK